MVYSVDGDCPVEVCYKKEPEPWIDEQISSGRWGGIDDVYFEITDYDPDKEAKGIIVNAEPPENPENAQFWMHPDHGILYSWNAIASKWLSVDRAAFIPEENLRSTSVG